MPCPITICLLVVWVELPEYRVIVCIVTVSRVNRDLPFLVNGRYETRVRFGAVEWRALEQGMVCQILDVDTAGQVEREELCLTVGAGLEDVRERTVVLGGQEDGRRGVWNSSQGTGERKERKQCPMLHAVRDLRQSQAGIHSRIGEHGAPRGRKGVSNFGPWNGWKCQN